MDPRKLSMSFFVRAGAVKNMNATKLRLKSPARLNSIISGEKKVALALPGHATHNALCITYPASHVAHKTPV